MQSRQRVMDSNVMIPAVYELRLSLTFSGFVIYFLM
jgi:hypothetical protein